MRKVFALAVAGALVFAAPAWADREHSSNNTSKKLREAVTVPGILEHEAALQRISTFNGGNRLSGAPGYDGSANYVAEQPRPRDSTSPGRASTTSSTCSPTTRRRW
jgi:hypothetical protein